MSDRLIHEILHDRDSGTDDAWWRSRVSGFVLPEGYGAEGGQDTSDRERILRLPNLERALIRLATAARACVHTSPPHDAHAALAAVLDEIGAPPHG